MIARVPEASYNEFAAPGGRRLKAQSIMFCLSAINTAFEVLFPVQYYATIRVSSSVDSTVDRGTFGPIGRSSGLVRIRHLATVFGLMP